MSVTDQYLEMKLLTSTLSPLSRLQSALSALSVLLPAEFTRSAMAAAECANMSGSESQNA
jgi:hypothetical protein